MHYNSRVQMGSLHQACPVAAVRSLLSHNIELRGSRKARPRPVEGMPLKQAFCQSLKQNSLLKWSIYYGFERNQKYTIEGLR